MLGIQLRTILIVASVVLIVRIPQTFSDDGERKAHQEFVKQLASDLRSDDRDPVSRDQWLARRDLLRSNLTKAWGGFPSSPGPLNARILGQIEREDYRVEKVVFQTLPDVIMTANAYVPKVADRDSRLPAVLCVHGHWAGAKQDPVVQSRCIGLAKLGFFVLSVDAFGAGERAIDKKLGEYHGEMTGAMLLPIGRPLSGIQVYENMRAVDYLQSRPEVDPQRIGITGASGGGNQTMYAGGFDERFRCVVPTCSVGTYRAYLSAACCMCEVVPGAMQFTEEGDILGLAAQRGLMVTSATRDAFQFSVEQATLSVARANHISQLLGNSKVKHTIIESPHHYNQPMREAMYGWMSLHLKGQGDGSPIPEPAIKTEDPEDIRCYPGTSRPDDFMTIPRFAFREAQEQLQNRRAGEDRRFLDDLTHSTSVARRAEICKAETEKLIGILGGLPKTSPLNLVQLATVDAGQPRIAYDSEPGIRLSAWTDAMPRTAGNDLAAKAVLLCDLDENSEVTFNGELARQLRASGWRVVVLEFRATARLSHPSDKIGNAIDHNSAEWSLWVGRPLLGQWVWDIRRAIDALKESEGALPSQLAVVGVGSAGTVALAAAALDERIQRVAAVKSLATFTSDQPYRGMRLGLMVPNVLRQVGDVSHIAALVAPRIAVVAGAVSGVGTPLPAQKLAHEFQHAREVYSKFEVSTNLRLASTDQAVELLNK